MSRTLLFATTLLITTTTLAQSPLGSQPSAELLPHSEFVFEERVTVGDPVVVGDTAFGHRQYVPITGGKIAGPKLNGDVLPGGWDFQLWLANGCGTLSADYFLRADDGTIIHILNESFTCTSPQTKEERSFFHPRFEAPKGKYEWLMRSTFVATLELEMSHTESKQDPKQKEGSQAATPAKLEAVRIKFYQIK
jgi:hypothetical protein